MQKNGTSLLWHLRSEFSAIGNRQSAAHGRLFFGDSPHLAVEALEQGKVLISVLSYKACRELIGGLEIGSSDLSRFSVPAAINCRWFVVFHVSFLGALLIEDASCTTVQVQP